VSQVSSRVEHMQQVRRAEKARREVVLARCDVPRQAVRRGRYERVRKQIEGDRERVRRLRVLADPGRTGDELAIERVPQRLKAWLVGGRLLGTATHGRGALHQVCGMGEKGRRNEIRAGGGARVGRIVAMEGEPVAKLPA